MRLSVKLLILFIYVFILLVINIPKLADNHYLGKKLYLFFGLFIFEFIVTTADAFYNKVTIETKKTVRGSLLTALVGTLSYSLYLDAWKTPQGKIPNMEIDMKQDVITSAVVTVGVMIEYLIDNHLSLSSK